jgi:shikimate kinase
MAGLRDCSLIGFMGCGKSVVGKLLAERLGCPFIDCDEQIAKAAGMEIRDIFKSRGEPYFRALESEFIENLKNISGVVSTGGGVVTDDRNAARIRARGPVIYLKASPERIFSHLRDDDSRPLLGAADKLAEIKRLMSVRGPLYERAAHIAVEIGLTPYQTVDIIIDKFQDRIFREDTRNDFRQ